MGQETAAVTVPPDVPAKMASVSSAATALDDGQTAWTNRMDESLREPTYTDPRTVRVVAELRDAWAQEVVVYAGALRAVAAMVGEGVEEQEQNTRRADEGLSRLP